MKWSLYPSFNPILEAENKIKVVGISLFNQNKLYQTIGVPIRIVIQRLSGKPPCFFLSLGLSGDNRTIRRLSEDYSKTKIIRRLLYADPKSEDSRKQRLLGDYRMPIQRLLEDYWTPFRRLLKDYWKLIRGQLKTKTIRRQFEADPKTYP